MGENKALLRLCEPFIQIDDMIPLEVLVLEPGGIDHSESSRNNQSELIRNSQCTSLAN